MSQPSALTLSHSLWAGDRFAILRAVVLGAIGVALLTLSAKAKIVIGPVPVTMQTLVVLLMAAAYGWRQAAGTIVAYFAVGLAGYPVFAGEIAGPAYFIGTSAGYLLAFLPAVILVGWLAERGWDKSVVTTVVAMVLGNLVIYAIGASWLSTMIGVQKAWIFGVVPFLAGDAIKIGVAALALPAASHLLSRR